MAGMAGADIPLLVPMLALAGALVLAVLAALVLGRSAEESDIAAHLRTVLNPAARIAGRSRAPGAAAAVLVRPFRHIGEALRRAAIVSEKDVAGFQRQMAAAGFNPRAAVPTFIGIKAVLLVGLPVIGLGLGGLRGLSTLGTASLGFAGLAFAILGPNVILTLLRRPYETRLRHGLPDALDMLVVAVEAGLGLESALERVVAEMRRANRAVALELTILLQELRLLPDRRVALERFAARTGVRGFERLASTLAQTFRYGTPLSHALRALATELRQERMMAIEERAIRLPALLVIPLILFILPAMFIALIGPSVLEFSRTLGALGR
jgi:tight adherence protein C